MAHVGAAALLVVLLAVVVLDPAIAGFGAGVGGDEAERCGDRDGEQCAGHGELLHHYIGRSTGPCELCVPGEGSVAFAGVVQEDERHARVERVDRASRQGVEALRGAPGSAAIP